MDRYQDKKRRKRECWALWIPASSSVIEYDAIASEKRIEKPRCQGKCALDQFTKEKEIERKKESYTLKESRIILNIKDKLKLNG